MFELPAPEPTHKGPINKGLVATSKKSSIDTKKQINKKTHPHCHSRSIDGQTHFVSDTSVVTIGMFYDLSVRVYEQELTQISNLQQCYPRIAHVRRQFDKMFTRRCILLFVVVVVAAPAVAVAGAVVMLLCRALSLHHFVTKFTATCLVWPIYVGGGAALPFKRSFTFGGIVLQDNTTAASEKYKIEAVEKRLHCFHRPVLSPSQV